MQESASDLYMYILYSCCVISLLLLDSVTISLYLNFYQTLSATLACVYSQEPNVHVQ